MAGSKSLRWWQVPYTAWAYAWFFIMVAPLGALGYALLALSPSTGRERRMLWVNQVLVSLWAGLVGMRYRVVNPERLHAAKAFVITPTHTTTLDMMIASFALRRGMRFLVKKELKRIPLLGFMFSRIGVFVDRSDAKSRRHSLDVMKAWASQGISLCVFPEGTRNRSGEPLGRFYRGAFEAAIHAGVPVLPVVLEGGPALMPMHQPWIRPGTLTARFLDPIPTTGLSVDDAVVLQERVFRIMYHSIIAHDARFSHRTPLGENDALQTRPSQTP